MKRQIALFLSVAMLLFSAVRASAQEQKEFSRFEVSASVGFFMGGMHESEPSSFPLLYDVTGRYYPKSWLSVGLSLGNDMDVYWGGDFLLYLTPSVNFHWLRKRSFTAYSGIGFSCPLTKWSARTGQNWYHLFQYTPIGITFGRSLYGLVELGYGLRYFPLRVGIGYRF